MNAPFTVTGEAVPGKRLGTKLGFPTANLRYEPCASYPPDGVYVAEATAHGRAYLAILNQGRHPTVPDGAPTIEAHLLDYDDGPLYGATLTLRYLRYLRPETRFPTLEALRGQLARDKDEARRWAARNEPLDAKENP